VNDLDGDLEDAAIAIIQGARYLVMILEGLGLQSPEAVDFRSRLRDMRHTSEGQLSEARSLPACRERDHIVELLTLALSEIPPNLDAAASTMQ
jgi:hypothetical protein